jgi:hypothetical protein
MSFRSGFPTFPLASKIDRRTMRILVIADGSLFEQVILQGEFFKSSKVVVIFKARSAVCLSSQSKKNLDLK